MTVKEYAERYHLTQATVCKYCKHEMIDGAKKIDGKWRIPDDAIRPLTEKQMRRMLVSLLMYKNNPATGFDFSQANCNERDILKYLKYLSNRNLILGFKEEEGGQMPMNVYVSNKGLDLLFNSTDKKKWSDVIKELGRELLPVVIKAIV
jgi:hypothetical protein